MLAKQQPKRECAEHFVDAVAAVEDVEEEDAESAVVPNAVRDKLRFNNRCRNKQRRPRRHNASCCDVLYTLGVKPLAQAHGQRQFMSLTTLMSAPLHQHPPKRPRRRRAAKLGFRKSTSSLKTHPSRTKP